VKAGIDQLHTCLRAWGEFSEISQLEGSNRTTAMLVQRGDQLLVAKTTARSPEALRWLAGVLPRAKDAGFVVPSLVPTANGELVAEGVTLETWVEGSPLPRADFHRVQPLIREFHRLTRGFPQRPGFASSQELLSLERGGDVDLANMPEHLVAACRAAWMDVASSDLCVVHGDLNPGNLLLTPTGRIGLIDWDETRLDLALFDEAALHSSEEGAEGADRGPAARALLAWEVAACWHVEPEYARRLASELE
jgi:Ser/Thr protein kinase RdoA (MazF antagonist)